MNFRRAPESPFTNVDHLVSIRCISEMAFAMVLAKTGTEFEDGRMDDLCSKVACVAEEYFLLPEDIQRVLEMHEPSLAQGDMYCYEVEALLRDEDYRNS